LKLKRDYFWAIAVLLLTSPLYILFDQEGKPGTGRAAWVCAGMFVGAVKMRWYLRNRPWFWITIACLLALHVPLILCVPWTSRWVPAVVMLPIGLLDILIILACVASVEKLAKGSLDSGE
jgi:hypothetical protein